MTNLQRHTKRFINAVREHPEFLEPALKYAKYIEGYISHLEMECTHKDVTILELLKQIELYIDILKSYGVDIGKLGSTSIFMLKEQIESAENGLLSIPENLISHKKR